MTTDARRRQLHVAWCLYHKGGDTCTCSPGAEAAHRSGDRRRQKSVVTAGEVRACVVVVATAVIAACIGIDVWEWRHGH